MFAFELAGTKEQSYAGTALVIHTEERQRLYLAALLKHWGYFVVAVENGKNGVEAYHNCQPDLVFVDAMLSLIEGIQHSREIKALAQVEFTPIIFVSHAPGSTVTSEGMLEDGDEREWDISGLELFKDRVKTARRLRELHFNVQEQLARIQLEENVAQEFLSRAVSSGQSMPPGVNHVLRSAATFCGDMLVSGQSPGGEIHLMLGDFTGHGLVAALGALPASQVFRTMIGKGFSQPDILIELNQKLRETLPPGMFLATGLITLSADRRSALIWNGGLPDILLLDGETRNIKCRVQSTHLALAILPTVDNPQPTRISIQPGDCIVIHSDGVAELRNPMGEMFGEERVEQTLVDAPGDNALDRLLSALDDFSKGRPPMDDMSIATLICPPAISFDQTNRTSNKQTAPSALENVEFEWQSSVHFNPAALKRHDLVPQVLSQLEVMEDIKPERQALFTVITELFNNALDHGLLRLDSAIKHSSAGFCEYFSERARRLSQLEEGSIRMTFAYFPGSDQKRLKITVEDSGDGFDYRRWLLPIAPRCTLHGRGIALVRQLCESLEYNGNGNHAKAIYAWESL